MIVRWIQKEYNDIRVQQTGNGCQNSRMTWRHCDWNIIFTFEIQINKREMYAITYTSALTNQALTKHSHFNTNFVILFKLSRKACLESSAIHSQLWPISLYIVYIDSFDIYDNFKEQMRASNENGEEYCVECSVVNIITPHVEYVQYSFSKVDIYLR